MTNPLDQFSKSLAAGASRRRALGALLAGSALALPFTAEGGKNKGKKKRKLRQTYAPYQNMCYNWCKINAQLPDATVNYGLCIKAAKEGKGPCFSTSAGGSGASCLDRCPSGQFCCPALGPDGKVNFTQCCTSECDLSLNNTLICTT